jgi:hypothetical protein
MASSMTNLTTADRFRNAIATIEPRIELLEQLDPTNWELPQMRALRTEWQDKVRRFAR